MPPTEPVIFVAVLSSIKRSLSQKSEKERRVLILPASTLPGPLGWPGPWPVAVLLSRLFHDSRWSHVLVTSPSPHPFGSRTVNSLLPLVRVPALSLSLPSWLTPARFVLLWTNPPDSRSWLLGHYASSRSLFTIMTALVHCVVKT